MRISDWSSDVCSSELGVGKFLRLESMDGIQLEAEDLQMADGKLCLLLRERGFGGQVGKDDLGQRADDAREALVGIGGHAPAARKSVVEGKSVAVRVDLGGRRLLKQKTTVSHSR